MTHLTRARRLASPIAGVLLAALLPAIVLAHAELETSSPADGATIESPFDGPIVLDFSAALVEGSNAELVGPIGSIVTESIVGPGATMTLNPVGDLGPGEYEVRWTSIAEDGDVARGTIEFTVAPPASTPEPTSVPTPTPAASATATPVTPATAMTEPSEAPSPPPSPDGGTAAGTGDVLLPIIVALAVVGGGAVYLLTRRNRPAQPG